MAGWLNGKAAFITGGSSGIGRAVAVRFVAEGARVCVLDRSSEKLADLSAELGENMIGVQGDVRSLADNERAVAAAVGAFGRLDTFVGNAGVFDGRLRLQEMAGDQIDRVFDEVFSVNVKGYLLGARASIPELLKTGGSMVFTASVASLYAGGGGPVYTASKHAVLGLVRQLAQDLAPTVRVNGVAPGGTLTALSATPTATQLGARDPFKQLDREALRQRSPLQIIMEPEDHTGAYVLLASDQARTMTGVVIPSDGGWEVRSQMPGH